jgi:Fe-S cluster assembly protein SufB
MEWVDSNLGSKVTMKYPSCYLVGPGARGEILSMAFAGKGQQQDTGGKVIHFAPHTSSKITSKSISKNGGRASYRGLLKVYKGAEDVKSNVVCDALLLDPQSRSDTYPYIEIDEDDVTIGHEASVSKIGEEQLFYLMSRGLNEEQATTMGFRIHRALGQGTAHGICSGDEPPHTASDGRIDRLIYTRKMTVENYD